jgi:CubicO group peptidase (beta-lactamase class C family)
MNYKNTSQKQYSLFGDILKKFRINHPKICVIIFFIALYGCSVSDQKALDVDKVIQIFLSEKKLPGISISIAKKGEIVYSNSFGYANIEKKTLIDPSKTKFRIGSVSKTFAAASIAKLYEEGKLDIDKSVYEYVPEFPKKKWSFNTRQMAGHLSGIRHYKNDEMRINQDYESVIDALKIFSLDTLLHEPGSKYHYSTHAWTLISLIIERASEVEFLAYMNDKVFDQLGMTNTLAEFNNQNIPNRVSYYQYTDQDTFEVAPTVNNSWKWAGGGFLSTTEDVIKFLFAHSKPGFLNKETLDLLMTSQKTNDGEETNYGLGWRTRKDRNGDILYGHTGGSVGGTTYAFWNKKTDIILVIASNIGSAKFGDLPLDIFDIYR